MDPSSLLLAVASLTLTIDQTQKTHSASSGTLSIIWAQLKLLQTGIERIQTWLHYADAASNSYMKPSLDEAFSTVHASLERLQDSLPSVSNSELNDTSFVEGIRGTQWTCDEQRIRRNLTDVRECVSLIHFTLSVCQLPSGKGTERQVKELGVGARTLSRAQTLSRRERQSVLQRQRSEQGHQVSEIYNDFVNSVLDAEEDLPEDLPEVYSPEVHSTEIYSPEDYLPDEMSEAPTSRRTSWDTYAATEMTLSPTNGDSYDDRFSAYLPNIRLQEEPQGAIERSSPSTIRQAYNHSPTFPQYMPRPLLRNRSESYIRRSDGPEPPPKVPEKSGEGSQNPARAINRKPLRRESASADSSTTPSVASSSYPVEKRNGEAFLSPAPSSFQQGAASATTNMLLNQASRSLSNLTHDVNQVAIADSPMDSPPPYADPPSPPMEDVKRRPTINSLQSQAEPPNVFQLVQDNRLDLLREMLEQGIALDEIDPITKRTPIMEAAHLRRSGAARILVRFGCRLHLKDFDGNSALHFAAAQGDVETCRILLDAGAQLDEYNNLGETPIILAARNGASDAIVCLLNSWTAQKTNGTALLKGFLEATKSGSVRTAEAFVERGIKPKKLEESWQPIANAAQSGSIPMIDFLFAHKLRPSEKSPEGWTALHFAAANGHTPMVEKLLAWKLSWKSVTKKSGETALHLAILGRHSTTAMALIMHKDANITMKDSDGHQAIHHAVRNGDVAVATALLNKGAKLDDQTKYGWTPMLLAAAYGHVPLVAEFITRGVSLEERLDSPSFKPEKKTNAAARKGYWAEIRWPHSGSRPLHLALEFGYDDVANVLIASGARLEESDSKGWKPLHTAAFNCRVQMVEMLLDRHVSAHSMTDECNTALRLGFRGPGLVATQVEKDRIYELLQGAMNAKRKTKLEQINGMRNIVANRSRDAGERNKAWHTAELAAALYQSGQLEDDEDSRLSMSISNQYDDEDEYYNETPEAQQSSSRTSRFSRKRTD